MPAPPPAIGPAPAPPPGITPPAPAAPPPPAPPAATPLPQVSPSPVRYPRHRTAARPAQGSRGGATSPIVFVLLITVPAVVAVAALRAR
ncbi:hypothetical protein [Streptomyces sp. SHP 1-2]|uniref:hypothetical protein n=1 Tax=Streptomyces sp. SHP 1-2 TaxID=2769489 RepID=UPI002237D043|nr:hypothetical protein [Streptomyces sp. SHP 1-2]MCW5250304.1 hypothetical protein [Streptomyces sp. SHP 1-2]